MREIKFRAWMKDAKLMIEDVVPIYNEVYGLYCKDFKQDTDKYLKLKNAEIMQYTGVKDKDGVEIYEGDILYFEPYETHGNDRVVQYINGAYHGRLIRSGYSKLLSECVYETKVIGNIHEDPELLEV